MNTVRSRLSDRSRISSSKAAAPIGSRPEVGSSRNSSSGSSASARARPARLIMPPESSAGFSAPAPGGRPTRAIFRSASSSISSWSRSVCSNIGAATFSLTVRLENSAPCWNSTPQRRLIALHCGRPAQRMSWPKTITEPPSAGLRPMMVLSSTDLPVPERADHAQDLAPLHGQVEVVVDRTLSPKREIRPRTSMGGASPSSGASSASVICRASCRSGRRPHRSG